MEAPDDQIETTAVSEVPPDRMDDPRELEPRFLRLPRHAQDQLRAEWRMAEMRGRELRERRKQTHVRYVLEGALLFAFTEFWLAPAFALVAALGFGAAAGGLAALLRAGTYHCGWIAFVAYLAYSLLTPWGTIFGLILYVSVSACLGAIHRLQKFDGSEC